MKEITVSWFSAGVSSAVATKLMADEVDHIIYQHIDDHHPDTMRFVKDCEQWFGKEIEIQQSLYKNVENVCVAVSFVNGVNGAPCTNFLKRRMRKEWEAMNRFFCFIRYVWGMDANETKRASRLADHMREDRHAFPLIDRGIDKKEAHAILERAGIKRPAMYDLGYHNNNCVGCVKGGAGYWNKIRVDFPEVFKQRAEMERKIGGTCLKGVFLDELDPEAGRNQGPIVPECGAMCDVIPPNQNSVSLANER